MLILCHLFIGLAIGLFLYAWLKDEWLVFTVAFGSILPDIMDKPIGHLLFSDSIDNGRIFFHGLFVVGVVLVSALALYRSRYGILFAGLATGILSHQLLDAMWLDPVSWFFPLMGAYIPDHYDNYFIFGLWAELTSPTEWMFLFLSGALIFIFQGGKWKWLSDSTRSFLKRLTRLILRSGPWLLAIAGLLILITISFTPYPDIEEFTEVIVLGISCFLGTIFLYGWYPQGEWIGPEH